MSKGIIALDGDGVLLDYNRAYAKAWQRAFGVFPREREPLAYWAIDRWEVEQLDGERLDQLRASFDESHWESIPAIDGAVQACHDLAAAGYELVCVTALASHFANARLKNLRSHGFPIEVVIATDNAKKEESPKASALRRLKPVAFVDDFLPYMVGIPAEIHAALIMREPNGNPNTGEHLERVSSQHESLLDFSKWWLNQRD